ncbi:DUF368 domain-containing protein [Halocatena pleomorpha]|uniref:DUF368 domain-containing protein n=1 Tax=Halocatena pleomorpha TaxID=1785090 RepID=A0A3P3R918_9EURY|nr:DUF368 domain-containing protein [Halocatena pleomorpha]RRJ29865.1 DUF368 domain-containing protein [Halocatena pleomorpha]
MAANGLREWAIVYLKGLCMGAADSVPGVSGGTIALIAGIYERLIDAIAGLDPRVLQHVPRLHTEAGRTALVRDLIDMDVPFLIALGGGMVTALGVMSGIMHAAMKQFPTPTAAFFFGLIAAAAVVLFRYVSVDSPNRIAVGLVGFGLAVYVAGFTEGSGGSTSLVILFGSGALAISAMVLPGVSGAFILYMLGLYEYMSGLPGKFISELSSFVGGGDPSALIAVGTPIAVFIVGALIGLFTIAHAVKYALEHYREATLTFLVSLMVGSLRAPTSDIAENAAELSPTLIGASIVAGIGGALLVIALDRFTEDIEFGSDDQRSPRTEAPVND